MPAISPALSLAAVVPPQVLDDGSASSKPALSSRLTLPLAVRRRLQPERNVSSVIYAIRPFRHSTDCSATSVAGTSESNEDHVDHVATRHTLDLSSSIDPEDRDHANSIMELQEREQEEPGSPSKLRHFTSLQQMGRDKIEKARHLMADKLRRSGDWSRRLLVEEAIDAAVETTICNSPQQQQEGLDEDGYRKGPTPLQTQMIAVAAAAATGTSRPLPPLPPPSPPLVHSPAAPLLPSPPSSASSLQFDESSHTIEARRRHRESQLQDLEQRVPTEEQQLPQDRQLEVDSTSALLLHHLEPEQSLFDRQPSPPTTGSKRHRTLHLRPRPASLDTTALHIQRHLDDLLPPSDSLLFATGPLTSIAPSSSWNPFHNEHIIAEPSAERASPRLPVWLRSTQRSPHGPLCYPPSPVLSPVPECRESAVTTSVKGSISGSDSSNDPFHEGQDTTPKSIHQGPPELVLPPLAPPVPPGSSSLHSPSPTSPSDWLTQISSSEPSPGLTISSEPSLEVPAHLNDKRTLYSCVEFEEAIRLAPELKASTRLSPILSSSRTRRSQADKMVTGSHYDMEDREAGHYQSLPSRGWAERRGGSSSSRPRQQNKDYLTDESDALEVLETNSTRISTDGSADHRPTVHSIKGKHKRVPSDEQHRRAKKSPVVRSSQAMANDSDWSDHEATSLRQQSSLDRQRTGGDTLPGAKARRVLGLDKDAGWEIGEGTGQGGFDDDDDFAPSRKHHRSPLKKISRGSVVLTGSGRRLSMAFNRSSDSHPPANNEDLGGNYGSVPPRRYPHHLTDHIDSSSSSSFHSPDIRPTSSSSSSLAFESTKGAVNKLSDALRLRTPPSSHEKRSNSRSASNVFLSPTKTKVSTLLGTRRSSHQDAPSQLHGGPFVGAEGLRQAATYPSSVSLDSTSSSSLPLQQAPAAPNFRPSTDDKSPYESRSPTRSGELSSPRTPSSMSKNSKARLDGYMHRMKAVRSSSSQGSPHAQPFRNPSFDGQSPSKLTFESQQLPGTPTLSAIGARDMMLWERALENSQKDASWQTMIEHRPRQRSGPDSPSSIQRLQQQQQQSPSTILENRRRGVEAATQCRPSTTPTTHSSDSGWHSDGHSVAHSMRGLPPAPGGGGGHSRRGFNNDLESPTLGFHHSDDIIETLAEQQQQAGPPSMTRSVTVPDMITTPQRPARSLSRTSLDTPVMASTPSFESPRKLRVKKDSHRESTRSLESIGSSCPSLGGESSGESEDVNTQVLRTPAVGETLSGASDDPVPIEHGHAPQDQASEAGLGFEFVNDTEPRQDNKKMRVTPERYMAPHHNHLSCLNELPVDVAESSSEDEYGLNHLDDDADGCRGVPLSFCPNDVGWGAWSNQQTDEEDNGADVEYEEGSIGGDLNELRIGESSFIILPPSPAAAYNKSSVVPAPAQAIPLQTRGTQVDDDDDATPPKRRQRHSPGSLKVKTSRRLERSTSNHWDRESNAGESDVDPQVHEGSFRSHRVESRREQQQQVAVTSNSADDVSERIEHPYARRTGWKGYAGSSSSADATTKGQERNVNDSVEGDRHSLIGFHDLEDLGKTLKKLGL